MASPPHWQNAFSDHRKEIVSDVVILKGEIGGSAFYIKTQQALFSLENEFSLILSAIKNCEYLKDNLYINGC